MSFIEDAAKSVGKGLGKAVGVVAVVTGGVTDFAGQVVGGVLSAPGYVIGGTVGDAIVTGAEVLEGGVHFIGDGIIRGGIELGKDSNYGAAGIVAAPAAPVQSISNVAGGHVSGFGGRIGDAMRAVNEASIKAVQAAGNELAGVPKAATNFSPGEVDPFGPITHSGGGGLLTGATASFAGLFAHIHPIQEATQMITQQQQATNDVAGMLKGFIPVIGSGWKGDDATQFGVDLNHKMLLALSGMDMRMGTFVGQINSAIDIVHQADHTVNRMVSELVDLFDTIF